MPLGKSIRIYLADGSVAGIRHGEIVNWTGQAIACPRARFSELKDWPEAKRPGVYFLFGQDEQSGTDAAYIGEAEIVVDRLYAHVSGKEFWTELVAFTSKDDNLTKGHVRYLESRLVTLAIAAGRYALQNAASPQLPALPRADRDAMEEFLDGTRILLGVLGHRLLEPLVARASQTDAVTTPLDVPTQSPITAAVPGVPPSAASPEKFNLRVGGVSASATRTDEGLVVHAGSQAAPSVQSSLSYGYRSLREKLLASGVLFQTDGTVKFAKDHLFTSPSQAAAIIVGYSINGRDAWRTSQGVTFGEYEAKLIGTPATTQSGQT